MFTSSIPHYTAIDGSLVFRMRTEQCRPDNSN
jgi:hypothetical protein